MRAKLVLVLIAIVVTMISLAAGTLSYIGPYKISFQLLKGDSTVFPKGPFNDTDNVTHRPYQGYVGLINSTANGTNAIIFAEFLQSLAVNKSLLKASLEDHSSSGVPTHQFRVDEMYTRRIDGWPAIVEIQTDITDNTIYRIANFCIDEQDGKGRRFVVLVSDPHNTKTTLNKQNLIG